MLDGLCRKPMKRLPEYKSQKETTRNGKMTCDGLGSPEISLVIMSVVIEYLYTRYSIQPVRFQEDDDRR